MQRALECTDAAHHGRDQVRRGRCDHARGERRCAHPVIDHGDEIMIERRRCFGARRGSDRHPQVVGGVTQRRIGRDRRVACTAPTPCRDEHRCSSDHRGGICEVIARAEQLCEAGPQRIHAVGRIECATEAGDELPGAHSRLAERKLGGTRATCCEHPNSGGFERVRGGELFDVETCDDQPAAFAVDIRDRGRRHFDSFEPAAARL